MTQEEIFSMALGITHPWYITEVKFTKTNNSLIMGRLDITIDFEVGSKFKAPNSEEMCGIHDTNQRSWRHINFFQHDCYLHARVPRVVTSQGNILQVKVPWAMEGSSFTLLFEAMSMLFIKEGMSMRGAGRMVKEDGRVIGRIIQKYVDKALMEQPLEQVKVAGIDEVSYKKGHNYFTILSNTEKKKVVGIGIGKGKEAVEEALTEMELRGSDRKQIEIVTADLSPSYIAAQKELLPNSKMIYDRFHIEQLLSKAIDELRKAEQVEATELKKSRWIWLHNKSNLNKEQAKRLHYLSICFPTLGQAYQLKEMYKIIWNKAYKKTALEDFKKWIKLVEKSKIMPLIKFVNTIKSHWSGIINYFDYLYTNAYAEQINSIIQNIKRTARGFRNINNFITMIYFKLGGLEINPLNMA